jgi:hypothetical protein
MSSGLEKVKPRSGREDLRHLAFVRFNIEVN